VGLPDLGPVAAEEHGIAVDRLALVPRPGAQASAVIAALLDGLDLVVVAGERGDPGPRAFQLSDAHARRLSARARHRGAVLLPFGPWPGADLELSCARSTWSGLGQGHGHLREREVMITARGRGAAARPLRTTFLLPGDTGAIQPVLPAVEELSQARCRLLADL
jgi:hypothetical protein